MRNAAFSLLIIALAFAAGCREQPIRSADTLAPTGWPAADRNRWPDTDIEERPPIVIPRLAEPFVVDGDVDEWAGALSAPVRSRTLAIYHQGDREWFGPNDAGIECFAAWNDQGICVAALLTDNELYNDRPADAPWDQDCATVVVQPRPLPPADPNRPDIVPGKIGLLIVPPRGETEADIYRIPRPDAESIVVEVKRSSDGYRYEALIPWALLPDITPEIGSPLALRFNIIDYDQRDGDQVVPFALVWHTSWYYTVSLRPPGITTPAVLGGELARSADADLEAEVYFDVNDCPPEADSKLPMNIDLGINVGRDARAVKLTATNWRDERVFTRRLGLASSGSSVGVRKSAAFAWSLDGIAPGQYTLTARILGAGDAPLGFVERDILITRGLAEEVLARIERAKLAKLAVTDPFHAIDWLEVATNLERFRQVSSRRDLPKIGPQARQLIARLALLETGAVSNTTDEMLDLLALASDHEAQVIVEYYPQDVGHVSLYWGPVPIVTVSVHQFADGAAAREAFQAIPTTANEPTTYRLLQGRRIISATNASAQVAQGAVEAVAAEEPITLAQIDAFRQALVEEIEIIEITPLSLVPDEMKLFIGDVHMHTIFSDGSYSPVYMSLQSFASGMDFSIITDHNDIVGGQLAQAHAQHYGFDHPIIVGDEITTSWAHLNGYPLREMVDWELAPYEIVRNVHAQGAAIQWNHPTKNSDWGKIGFAHGIGPLGVDAWEHVPPDHDQWRAEGKLPTLVGSTDEHAGYFFNLERSIIFAPSPGGVDVADAVRRGNVCLIDPRLPNVLYGAPHMIALAREAIAEGTILRERRMAAIAEALADMDITGLILSSGQRKIDAGQAAELIEALHEH